MSDADVHTQNPQYAVAGDQSAARELQRVLSLYLPSFYRCALRVLGNRDDAEDAVQDALLAAHKHLHQFRGQSQMSTWKVADARPSPEDECRNSELAAHLRKCTALLLPSLRRTFQLRVVDGLSILEIAQLLGVPQGTVKAQLARARRKLTRYMQRVLAPSRRPHLSGCTSSSTG